jgi:hypothetical protein
MFSYPQVPSPRYGRMLLSVDGLTRGFVVMTGEDAYACITPDDVASVVHQLVKAPPFGPQPVVSQGDPSIDLGVVRDNLDKLAAAYAAGDIGETDLEVGLDLLRGMHQRAGSELTEDQVMDALQAAAQRQAYTEPEQFADPDLLDEPDAEDDPFD